MSENQNETSTTPTDIDESILNGYSEFDIGITPVVKPVGRFESDEPQGADGTFNPPPIQGVFDDGMGEATTLEECISLSRMLWNTPGMLMGDHLIRSDEQIELYGKELYLYCSKKGIDPRDYVGDWMPLAVMTGTMGIGLWKDHKEYKKTKTESAGFNKPAGANKSFDTGKGVTDSGSHAELDPLKRKENLNPASSSGGDNITEIEVTEEV